MRLIGEKPNLMFWKAALFLWRYGISFLCIPFWFSFGIGVLVIVLSIFWLGYTSVGIGALYLIDIIFFYPPDMAFTQGIIGLLPDYAHLQTSELRLDQIILYIFRGMWRNELFPILSSIFGWVFTGKSGLVLMTINAILAVFIYKSEFIFSGKAKFEFITHYNFLFPKTEWVDVSERTVARFEADPTRGGWCLALIVLSIAYPAAAFGSLLGDLNDLGLETLFMLLSVVPVVLWGWANVYLLWENVYLFRPSFVIHHGFCCVAFLIISVLATVFYDRAIDYVRIVIMFSSSAILVYYVFVSNRVNMGIFGRVRSDHFLVRPVEEPLKALRGSKAGVESLRFWGYERRARSLQKKITEIEAIIERPKGLLAKSSGTEDYAIDAKIEIRGCLDKGYGKTLLILVGATALFASIIQWAGADNVPPFKNYFLKFLFLGYLVWIPSTIVAALGNIFAHFRRKTYAYHSGKAMAWTTACLLIITFISFIVFVF